MTRCARDFTKIGPTLNWYLPFWMTNYDVTSHCCARGAIVFFVVPVFNYVAKLFLWFIHAHSAQYRRLVHNASRGPKVLQELESIVRAANIVPMRDPSYFLS